jgi:hypothetical protein
MAVSSGLKSPTSAPASRRGFFAFQEYRQTKAVDKRHAWEVKRTTELKKRDRRPACFIGHNAYEQVARPVEKDGQRASGLRFDDPRAQALFSSLVLFGMHLDGFCHQQLRDHLAELRGSTLGLSGGQSQLRSSPFAVAPHNRPDSRNASLSRRQPYRPYRRHSGTFRATAPPTAKWWICCEGKGHVPIMSHFVV